jgi:hypothetical protein
MRGFGVVGLLVAVLFSGLVQSSAHGQLFRNLFPNRRVQSGCPNGVCPTAARPFSNARAGHWTFPGSIDGHLNSTHGVSTAGLSREQMLNLHDALHEGRSVSSSVTSSVIVAPRPVVTSSIVVASAPIVMRPTVAPVLPAVNDVPIEMLQLAPEPGFRGELRKAITEARKANNIDVRTAFRLQTLTFSPAFVRAAQDVAVTQMVLSGESSDAVPKSADGRVDVAGINWGELGKFLQLVIPLLLELMKAFGL